MDPKGVEWRVGDEQGSLFGGKPVSLRDMAPAFAVPKAFIELARTVICHRDHQRFALLYEMLWRLRADSRAFEDKGDPVVRQLEAMAKSVRRDIHKMRAFLRFRKIETEEEARFVAWFEPDHHIVRSNAGFFIRRFGNMHWSILTPDLCLHWDCERLTSSPGAQRGDAPSGDPVEECWKSYYSAIFNPARVKIGAMLKEMPKKYWKNMPETALVGQLVAQAQAREAKMVENSRVRIGDNVQAAWQALRSEALGCTRCPLHECATRTVFGEGPLDSRILFVGEQPGDQEDLAGRPFVGPAGQLFDKALVEAGVDRTSTYVTNAVKHFKFERSGKRRIHSKPNGGEIAACRWWIDQEISLIQPSIIVALGATAVRSLFGRSLTIASLRGQRQRLDGGAEAWVTVHPSFLLRVRDNREAEYERFVGDLRQIKARAEAVA